MRKPMVGSAVWTANEIVFMPTPETENKRKGREARELSGIQGFDPTPMLRRQAAYASLVALARKLVDNALFTLSVEDFAILEAAIKDYDNT